MEGAPDERARSRGLTALAVGLAVGAFALSTSGLALVAANSAGDAGGAPEVHVFGGFVVGLTYPVVGVLIALRHWRNPIGWIYLAIGLSQGLSAFAAPYSKLGLLTSPGSLPLADTMAWLEMWAWAPGFTLFSSVSLLLFPDGRHLSPRWRVVTVLSIVATVLLVVPMALVAWSVSGVDLVRIDAGIGGDDSLVAGAVPLQSAGLVVALVASAASIVSLVLRWRRSRGIEREQLKWLAFVVSIVFPLYVLTLVFPQEPLFELIALVGFPLVPISIGIAILRYRLYEIDRIINRTLVYGMLTAILAGVFAAASSVLQGMFTGVLGPGIQASNIMSTILVVAAFQPVKERVQALVDRRFKEVPDPTVALAGLAAQFDTRLWPVDPAASLQRLLVVSVAAFGASGGTISLNGRPMAQSGPGGETTLHAIAGDGASRVAIAIGPRTDGRPYVESDRQILEPAVAAIARALQGVTT